MEDEIRQRLAALQYDEAFGLLLEQFKDKVFRLALSMVHDQSHAEDLAQDVFVRIWKNLPGYHGGASLSTWIYVITRNTCLTQLKKSALHPTVSLQQREMERAAEFVPALQSRDRESGVAMDVHSMLAELPQKYRQVITLFYLEQKAYEEVATMLNLPLGTVKTLIFRAKKELLRIGSRTENPVASAKQQVEEFRKTENSRIEPLNTQIDKGFDKVRGKGAWGGNGQRDSEAPRSGCSLGLELNLISF